MYVAYTIVKLSITGKMLVEGAVVIDEIVNSEYILLWHIHITSIIEDVTPTMKDINRYVKKYAANWRDIGLELGLEDNALEIIKKDNPQQSVTCLQGTWRAWLKEFPDATWKKLEVALTNVKRQELGNGLCPVDSIYYDGKIYLITNFL